MSAIRTFNLVKNLSLFCIEANELKEKNGLRLSCMLNGRKIDGKPQKGFPISVVVINNNCECSLKKDEFTKCKIDVDGGITATGYTGKDGIPRSSVTLFADKVCKHEWQEGDSTDFNICINLSLFCMESVEIKEGKGIRLSCMLNGKIIDDKPQKGVPISVICMFDKCQIDKKEMSKCKIDVEGNITASEYKSKDGKEKSGLVLFAQSVKIHEWKKD